MAELPGWFRLASYEPQGELSLSGWLRQLAVRTELRLAPRPLKKYQIADLDEIRAHPIVPAESKMLELNCWTDDLKRQLQGSAWAHPPTRQMQLRDLMFLLDDMGGDQLHEARNLHRRICIAPGVAVPDIDAAIEAMQQEHLFDRHVDDLSDARSVLSFVAVDLTLPDDVIVAGFRHLLPSLRELADSRAHLPTPATAKVDPTAWAKFAILPYLDLQMWAQEANVHVPYRVLADAIFQPGEGGEEVVRKTTDKIAKAVTTHVFLHRLVAASLAEIRNA